ncbi:ATPase, histidine kinase-, DNA gyrase B-, and HSP90-like domain protein [Synechococcus sp. PCC 7335]|uniref:sensor histidine kinase n=1 Tax=Synechococcus sp. (strain ATCC 29403 / PCC 7335) TaxID=91464 RepID=UPI00017EDFCF|nr:ATP-binding protein [Synechococcus sp. PCC 7335]EDX85179.1 ATPase, histidine kinase-, DNA gyrase B-, and HSP90-like domain protein [Synechococcus sp. PCC 7335]
MNNSSNAFASNAFAKIGHSLWQQFFKETRTRILLLYAFLMLILTGLTVPIFRYLLFQQVDQRVRANLAIERENFLAAFADWQRPNGQNAQDLKSFVVEYLDNNLVEDDNFQLVLIEGVGHFSSPDYLLTPFSPDSDLFEQWQTVTAFTMDSQLSGDPKIGKLLYKADPLIVDGRQLAVHVVVHAAAGERQETLEGVYVFSWMIVSIVALSLLLAWIGAGRLLKPIRELAQTARSISESNLTRRIPLPNGNGELTDLTHTFNDMMDRIQAAFDSQRDFINDAGHELRTPITIIQGHLELMDEENPQECRETIKLVMDELDRMGRLVSDMLLLAKSERPNFLQLETVEIDAFAEEIFTKATALAQRHWILKVEGKGNVVCDRQKLTGAILNLLKNAVQHTQGTDTIELGCYSKKDADHPNHDQVRFWVRDTGEGISPADQQRIFSRFARGQNYQRRSDGSGLGLAITAAVAEAHGGQVTLHSKVGQGTTFWLDLPQRRP